MLPCYAWRKGLESLIVEELRSVFDLMLSDRPEMLLRLGVVAILNLFFIRRERCLHRSPHLWLTERFGDSHPQRVLVL